MAGILAFGAFVPRLRLQRSAILAAHGWFAPGLKSLAGGERAVAAWDEDAITMAVEACRDCLDDLDRSAIETVILASTTAPFSDRQNAGLVKEALNLDDAIATLDLGGSQRAGLAAFVQAFRGSSGAATLCVASEKRIARPASEAEMTNGDAAAAFLIGPGDGLAKLVASAAISVDFVDHFRGSRNAFDYGWEARWIRDEGLGKIVPRAIAAVLERAGCKPDVVDHFILASPMRGVQAAVAKAAGLRQEAVRDPLVAGLGDAGAAHPLVMLAHALESATAGQRLLVAAFGSGCETVLLERTAAPRVGSSRGMSGWLARRKPETNYVKYLVANGLLDIERGMRAEYDQKQPLSALWRNRKAVLGLVGGRDAETGVVQFPKSLLRVGQETGSVEAMGDHPLADRPARILTYTADNLTYTLDPPALYGMVEFVGGGRLNAEFCDMEAEDLEVGRPMRMMFRVKAHDEVRGFKKYFWKAAPAH